MITKTEKTDRARVSMTLHMEPWEFARLRDDFLSDLAGIMEISKLDIEVISIRRGCTELELEIPLDKRTLFDMMKRKKRELSQSQLIEVANFIRKYNVVIFEELNPTIYVKPSIKRESPDKSLTWLHLSDVHFKSIQTTGARDSWAQDKVKETFIRDLPELLRSETLDPDFVFFTGDIANSGSIVEYDLAFEFFEQIQQRLPREDQVPIIMIPGNHDIDRTLVSQYAREEKEALKVLINNESIMDFMRLPKFDEKRGILMERLSNYNAFADRCQRFGQPARNHSEVITSIFDHGGLKIGIAGMNSAWRCSSNQDRGRLVLGIPQLDDAIKTLESSDIRLGLIHHPPESDWFVIEDMLYQRANLSFFDFILRGHEHDPHVQLSFFAGREYCHVSAGALYNTDAFQKSFNVIQLDLESSKAWVFFWKLSQKTLKWVKDVEVYDNGYYVFDMPSKLVDRISTVGSKKAM